MVTILDPVEILSHVSLFADLSAEELHALAHRTVSHHVHAGQMIFSEGDRCQGLFVVVEGEVKIFKTAPSGREQVLTIDGPGNAFAELPVFDGGPYPASATTTADSTLLFLSKDDFRGLCLEHPQVGLKVLKAVGSRLRRLVLLIEELSFTTVRTRVISTLVRLAETEGVRKPYGTEIALISNQEIAARIGTVRELVSRNLSRLQADGLIRIDGKQVLIPDVRALAAAGSDE